MIGQRTVQENRILFGAFFLHLLLKFSIFNLNAAEYTDGILQIIQHQMELPGFWPPLYNWLIQIISLTGLSGEFAGQFISIISSSLVIFPLYFLTRHICHNQQKAAIIAIFLYTFSPLHLRWSIRVMTDPLFVFLNFTVIYYLFNALANRSHAYYCLKYFIYANIFLLLATLTRYQGILVAPFYLYVLYLYSRRFLRQVRHWRELEAKTRRKIIKYGVIFLISLLPWFFVAYMYLQEGLVHALQVGERMGIGFMSSLGNYFVLFDAFIGHIPYFFNYFVVVFAFAGFLFITSRRVKQMIFKVFFFYYMIVLILLQSVFQSFQERYLLPLLPFFCLLAGTGFFFFLYEPAHRTDHDGIAQFRKRSGRFQWIYPVFLGLTAATLFITSISVLTFQSGSFGSIKEVAEYIKNEKIEGNIYTNEIYRPEYEAIKMRYWTGDDSIEYYAPYQTDDFEVEDYVAVHSVYLGDLSRYYAYEKHLHSQYHLEVLYRTPSYITIPIFPDNMTNFSNQNPMWSVFRFTPQYYKSSLYQVTGKK